MKEHIPLQREIITKFKESNSVFVLFLNEQANFNQSWLETTACVSDEPLIIILLLTILYLHGFFGFFFYHPHLPFWNFEILKT